MTRLLLRHPLKLPRSSRTSGCRLSFAMIFIRTLVLPTPRTTLPILGKTLVAGTERKTLAPILHTPRVLLSATLTFPRPPITTRTALTFWVFLAVQVLVVATRTLNRPTDLRYVMVRPGTSPHNMLLTLKRMVPGPNLLKLRLPKHPETTLPTNHPLPVRCLRTVPSLVLQFGPPSNVNTPPPHVLIFGRPNGPILLKRLSTL